MASPFARGISTAIKRAHSQDSLGRSGTPTSVKASKTEEGTATPIEPYELDIPAFLRQPKTDITAKYLELNWQEKIRLAQGRNDPESRWVQDTSQPVLQRNRYHGVQPWASSRIRLKVGPGSLDYINASPISLTDPVTRIETRYIATQGPTKPGMSHFWQMIWHETEKVAIIVMLTPTEESGREKCYQYFPLDAETSPFKVKATGHPELPAEGEVAFVELDTSHGQNTQVRKLHLTFGEESKTVWHLLFTAFPDFGVPEDEDRAELLDLLRLAAEKNSSPANPKTIHCSAGVGRSGTFIALEYLLSQLESGALGEAKPEDDPIYHVVHLLREQRMMMVQSEIQYHFLYDLLLEELQKKQLAAQLLEQPSPKLRKLNDGLKSAAFNGLDDATTDDIPVSRTSPVAESNDGQESEEGEEMESESSDVRLDEVKARDGDDAVNQSTVHIGEVHEEKQGQEAPS